MTYHRMIFCPECGTKLTNKFLEHEGTIPYCPHCQAFRFPIFNTAVSAILFNETHDSILLIKQYDMSDYILVAGYVGQGENLEDTVRREIQEELSLTVNELTFNTSRYYRSSNSLLVNFAVTVSGQASPKHEIDDWNWFKIDDAKKAIKDGSLAEEFLLAYLNQHEKNNL